MPEPSTKVLKFQYGSLFVWTVEGLILSLMWLSYSLVIAQVIGATWNSLDMLFSMTLVITYLITTCAHLFGASRGETTTNWHKIVSHLQCSLVFLTFTTYLGIYIDAGKTP